MTAVGVDWASGYWITATITDDDDVSIDAHPSIYNVWDAHHDANEILVDIPIGLPKDDGSDLEEGYRLCDAEALEILPPELRSSLFRVPCRSAVLVDEYKVAKRKNDDVLGHGLGSQSWCLVPRIREVDVFLQTTENAQETLRESHPEVCFVGLDGSLDVRKSESDGLKERRNILSGLYDNKLVKRFDEIRVKVDPDGEVVEEVADDIDLNADEDGEDESSTYTGWKHRITKTRLDDVLDALVLAHTANVNTNDREFLPKGWDDPPKDGENLPMQIVRPPT